MAAVLVAMTASLTVLPAVLTLLGPRIEWGTMPWRRRRLARADAASADGHGAWARIARSVMRRPVVYLVTITGALLLIGSPILGAQWGSVDERVLPEDSPSRVASDVVAENFGGDTATADIVVTGGSAADVETYVADLAAVPGVDDVRVVAAASAGDDATDPAAGQLDRRRRRRRRARTSCTSSATYPCPTAPPLSSAVPRPRPSTSSTRSSTGCR